MVAGTLLFVTAEQRVEHHLKRGLLFYCKEYCRGRVFNVLFKVAVNSMLIDFQKVEGSFCIGKCIISADDLLQGFAKPDRSGVRQGDQAGVLDSHLPFL